MLNKLSSSEAFRHLSVLFEALLTTGILGRVVMGHKSDNWIVTGRSRSWKGSKCSALVLSSPPVGVNLPGGDHSVDCRLLKLWLGIQDNVCLTSRYSDSFQGLSLQCFWSGGVDLELKDAWVKLSFWMVFFQMFGQGVSPSSFPHHQSVLIGSLMMLWSLHSLQVTS